MSTTVPYVVTFALYFAAMIGIGVWVYNRNRSLSDFILGGRSLGSWVAALSAMASDLSGWLLLGLPGAAYAAGVGGSAWILIGLFVGLYINWRFVAPRLRDYSEQATDYHTGKESDSLTLSEYFENRFEDRSHLLRMISAITIIVFFSIYVAAGLVGGGILFESVFGTSPTLGVSLTILVIVIYTFIGGFLAVSYTDSVQGVLMWSAIIIVPIVVFAVSGGIGPIIAGVESKSPELLQLTGNVSLTDGSWVASGTVGLVVIVSGLAWGAGYFGQPHILARFMAIRSASLLPRARRIGVTYGITAMSAGVIIGLAGIAFFDEPLSDPESVFLRLVEVLFNPWIAGVLLVGVLAAIMSTASSQLLVVASALTEDLYRTFFHREASGAHLLWVGRLTVVGVGLVAYVLALQGGTVLGLVAYAWAGFGAAFGTVLITSLFWRKMNRVGALAGMIAGGATVLIYKQIDTIGLYEMLPGVLAGFICIFVFNRFGATPTATMQSDFDTVAGQQSAGTRAESEKVGAPR